MKVLPLDADEAKRDALIKEQSEQESAVAKVRLANILADHTPPGGWPDSTTIVAANDAANRAANESHAGVVTPAMRSGARIADLRTPKDSRE